MKACCTVAGLLKNIITNSQSSWNLAATAVILSFDWDIHTDKNVMDTREKRSKNCVVTSLFNCIYFTIK